MISRTEYSKNYYNLNKQNIKNKSKQYRDFNKEKLNTKRLERETPEYLKNRMLKLNYGIDLDTYNKMFQDQNGCCAICGRHQSEFKLSLAVDHCHLENKVRSLLCSNCNTGLGNLRDSKELLVKAIKYLESHE